MLRLLCCAALSVLCVVLCGVLCAMCGVVCCVVWCALCVLCYVLCMTLCAVLPLCAVRGVLRLLCCAVCLRFARMCM